nr:MAG TPA: hypothetical protein [Caudoviricetes sp.]
MRRGRSERDSAHDNSSLCGETRRPGSAAAAASSAGGTALALCGCYRGGGQCALWASAASLLQSSAAGGNPRHCPRGDGSIAVSMR